MGYLKDLRLVEPLSLGSVNNGPHQTPSSDFLPQTLDPVDDRPT